MSVFALSLTAKFYTSDRSGKVIERKCADPLLNKIRNTRLPDMTAHLNSGVIASKCSGLSIKANVTNGYVYSKYSSVGCLSIHII